MAICQQEGAGTIQEGLSAHDQKAAKKTRIRNNTVIIAGLISSCLTPGFAYINCPYKGYFVPLERKKLSFVPIAPGENEQQLLRLIARSDMPAFHALYQLHAGVLQSYIYLFTRSKEDAEDILQEVFLRLWEKRQNLPDVANFRSYVFRMARNGVLNYLERVKPRLPQVALDEDMAISAAEDVADQLLFKQHYTMAMEAIELLPARRKEVFNLAMQEDLSFTEIAQKLGISVSAVKQQYYAAVSFIREYLRQNKAITSVSLLFFTLFQK